MRYVVGAFPIYALSFVNAIVRIRLLPEEFGQAIPWEIAASGGCSMGVDS